MLSLFQRECGRQGLMWHHMEGWPDECGSSTTTCRTHLTFKSWALALYLSQALSGATHNKIVRSPHPANYVCAGGWQCFTRTLAESNILRLTGKNSATVLRGARSPNRYNELRMQALIQVDVGEWLAEVNINLNTK